MAPGAPGSTDQDFLTALDESGFAADLVTAHVDDTGPLPITTWSARVATVDAHRVATLSVRLGARAAILDADGNLVFGSHPQAVTAATAGRDHHGRVLRTPDHPTHRR
ncbi:hypothetical protein [Actinosynnema sp. NPDC020468]|uniref:hypothetical protein n=1 Tax=Actinosynnema sp. NPDC020468 TaxID=3154488 RepID=UPI0033FA0D83